MRSIKFFSLTILLVFLLAGTLILSAYVQSPSSTQEVTGARAQITATPVVDDQSVIGSTDGIVIMGFVIVLIAVIPMMLRGNRR